MKEQKYAVVAEAAVKILLQGSVKDLTYTRLATKAGVSRAWLYKYFGKNPDALLDFVVDFFGRRFAELEGDRSRQPRPGLSPEAAWLEEVVEGTRRALVDLEAAPWLMSLFFRYEPTQTTLGKRMRVVEEQWFAHFIARLPQALRAGADGGRWIAEMIHSARLGLWYRWVKPEYRKRISVDSAMAGFEIMVRGFAQMSFARTAPAGGR